MIGVATESFSGAPSGRGKKCPVLCRENHTPNSVGSLSSRVENREEGRWMVPRTEGSVASSLGSSEILRGAVWVNESKTLIVLLEHKTFYLYVYLSC